MNSKVNIYNPNCPSRHLLSRIGDKWSIMILDSLQSGPIRFGAMKRICAGISQKMLTQTLRNLERDGLILRHVLQEKPLQIEYALSSLGKELSMTIAPVIAWVEAHYKRVESAQKKYDIKNL
jgi:DNA-binding HxlR family transcriptional regulator